MPEASYFHTFQVQSGNASDTNFMNSLTLILGLRDSDLKQRQ